MTSPSSALSLAGALALASCGEPPRTVDAQAAPTAESAEVSIRFDVSPGRPSTVQVLAFRATTTSTVQASGVPVDWHPDVLGIVDPLAASAPEQGCALGDIDLATTAVMLRGGSIELQELTGVGVGLGAAGEGVPAAETLLRPFPRLYPDVATIVGGVVAETGPQPLGALPERVTLFTADSELPVANLAVPAAPRMLALNGAALDQAPQIDARDGVAVTIAGGAGGRIELRPFGATIAAACAIPATAPAEAVVTIPRAFIAGLARSMGGPSGAPFAASIELARRVSLRPSPTSTSGARISVEVRSATAVELRP
ncbi:MAG TPA: hypothetical protein VHL80_06095 [Polyangia bacterium]|nr:hypothetical protein [Polyangia bacterium]